MIEKEKIYYERIAKAIEFIKKNFKDQPSLDEIADAVNLSPFHFQRIFSEWAGVSPKKFMQYLLLIFKWCHNFVSGVSSRLNILAMSSALMSLCCVFSRFIL